VSSPKRNVVARLGTRHTVQKEGKRSNNTVLDVRGNVTVAVLAIDVTKQMNRPRVARSKACYFISLLLVLLLGDSAICAADSTRQCAVPVGTKSFVFSSEGHTLRGFIEATAGGRNQPAILILHGSGSTDVMHDDRSDGGYYRAQREAFRSAGLATVVWDKAGDGCSEGQYPTRNPNHGSCHRSISGHRGTQTAT